MRTCTLAARGLRILPRRHLTGLLGVLALIMSLAVPAARATPPGPPKYSLSITEGETTQPEHSIDSTSGGVSPKASVAVSIVRNGTEVARSTGEGGAWMSQIPVVGDVVNLESPAKGHPGARIVGSVVYDGLPSIDATVCAGSVNFSGQRSSGQTVRGGVYTDAPHPYGGFEQTNQGQAQVTLLSGSTFSGSFLKPLALGQTVFAIEELETPLEGGAVFAYESENARPVGACPKPPPAPPPPPPPPALFGSIFKLPHATLRSVLRSGWRDLVTINMAGTITQDLYLQGGTLPAFASGKKHHAKRRQAAMLLARGSATAKGPGTVAVVLKLTSKGRRKFRSSRKVSAVLITTLRSTTGAKLTLERRSVPLHR